MAHIGSWWRATSPSFFFGGEQLAGGSAYQGKQGDQGQPDDQDNSGHGRR